MKASQTPSTMLEVKSFQPCLPTPVEEIDCPGAPFSMQCAKLPEKAKATAALASAPHFASLHALVEQDAPKVRLLLLSDTLYTATQGAAHFCATQTEDVIAQDEDEEEWEELGDFLVKLNDNEEKETSLFDGNLLQMNVARLFKDESADNLMEEEKRAQFHRALAKDAPRVVFHGDGAFLSQRLLTYLNACKQSFVAVALQPHQCQLPLMRQLCFEQGFQICKLPRPSKSYMKQQFEAFSAALHVKLSPSYNFATVLAQLQQMQGNRFSDADFPRLLEYTVRCFGDEKPMKTAQLQFPAMRLGYRNAMEKLDALIGLEEGKLTVQQMVADSVLSQRRTLAGIEDAPVHRNLTFAGEPGTCKSVTARILAQALQEAGVGTGAFVEAGREQLIGKYLGQTSPMVAGLFEKAKGGVLFIDEAGSLVGSDRDSYATEAINALVRHMELHPETIVVFATYPHEMQSFLASNPGLASRVARNLVFPAYDDDTLCQIFAYLAQDQHFTLPENWEALCKPFFAKLRKAQGNNFGNGREARRLLHSARTNLAMRLSQESSTDLSAITQEDLSTAMAQLLSGHKEPTRSIGFGA